MRRTHGSYDLIVFGLLDAQNNLFSTSNSIRLDNYVYTVESLEQALRRLGPNGILSISFYGEQPWIVSRLDMMLRQAWGHPPLVAPVFYDYGHLYLAGPGVAKHSTHPGLTVGVPRDLLLRNPPGPLATDSWPFLYLADRVVPPTLVRACLAILVLAALMVWLFFRGNARFDRHLFFLGAGFLLLETRTIGQLALFFGSTWRVSAITIGFVLALVLFANLLTQRIGALKKPPLYLALALALIANYVVPPSTATGAGLIVRLGFAAFLLLPVFFASLIFSSTVSTTDQLGPALASNLVGSVFGGIMENLALVIDLPALSLVALAVYLASFRR